MSKDLALGVNYWFTKIAVVSVVTALAIACGGGNDPKPATDSASIAGSPATAAIAETALAEMVSKSSGCPPTGLWALCSVEKRLEQAGFVVRKAATVPETRPGFRVAPAAYTLGRARLEVFVYPNAKALERDWSELDTVTASPHGKATAWELPPSLVRSANMAAVYLTDSPVQAERLSLALTAGPPQPGSARSDKSQVLAPVEVQPRK